MGNQVAENFPSDKASDKPLVTFALFAYNQEKYVREALEGALAQTYSRLEIILSDDCSTDDTFAIMQEVVKGYAGPHQIVLNKNAANLSIGAHINKIMSLASGELVVIAAGDDVSLPSRTATLVDAWLADNRRADLLCSDYRAIDEHGTELGNRKGCDDEKMQPDRMAASGDCPLGATAAWTRRLWNRFHDMPRGAVHEDQILSFRAALAGGVRSIHVPLVGYRVGVSTWLERSRTADTHEMRRRTELITKNAVITANIQLQDAISANRFDLVPLIVRRLTESLIVHSVYTRNTNIFSAVIKALRAGCKLKPVLRAVAQVNAPYLHKMILKRRAASATQCNSAR